MFSIGVKSFWRGVLSSGLYVRKAEEPDPKRKAEARCEVKSAEVRGGVLLLSVTLCEGDVLTLG
jgi:hypothetical protein